jgi:hypothetical protein
METEKPTWQELCQAASIEEDPQKLMGLIAEINRDLQKKEDRLRRHQPLHPTPPTDQADLSST